MASERVQIDKRVYCAECSTPILDVERFALVIKSKHHGEIHVTEIPLRDLIGEDDGRLLGRSVVRLG